MTTFPAQSLAPVGSDNGPMADVVPLRRRTEDKASCRRIQPWRTRGRLACASDLDCDPDKLCVDGECT